MVPSRGHLFYVRDLEAPSLDEADTHHAARVLRLDDGEVLSLSDGRGRWRRATWRRGAGPVDVGKVQVESRSEPLLTVGFALVKGDKPEVIVQKLTELGVDRIVPFVASRSVVRWDRDRAERATERMVATARAAGMQSRRAWLPEVSPVRTFAEAVAVPGALLADRDGRPLAPGDSTVLVGPEGGWDDAELAAATATVSLGTSVLRSETAAIAAGVLLANLREQGSQRPG